MNIGEQISKLAAQYDPDKEADGQASRSFLQGWLYMTASQDSQLKKFFRIAEVEQGVDTNGDYEPHFTVVTGSGHRIRVTLELEQ